MDRSNAYAGWFGVLMIVSAVFLALGGTTTIAYQVRQDSLSGFAVSAAGDPNRRRRDHGGRRRLGPSTAAQKGALNRLLNDPAVGVRIMLGAERRNRAPASRSLLVDGGVYLVRHSRERAGVHGRGLGAVGLGRVS